jgi:aminoglycoside phosphotransferase (APT) family kinase protein
MPRSVGRGPSLGPELLRWIARAVAPGARVVNERRVTGGSITVDTVDVAVGRGRPQRLAVRRYVNRERLRTDPWYDPANEARVLEHLDQTAVHAPRLVAADLDGAPSRTPVIVTSWFTGAQPIRPRSMDRLVDDLASELALIHSVPAMTGRLPLRYARYYEADTLRVPHWSARPDLWSAAIAASAAAPETAPHPLIHRDFHHLNTIWWRGRLRGVIDWPTACTGPAAIDLARARQNLAGDFGPPWPDRFLAR